MPATAGYIELYPTWLTLVRDFGEFVSSLVPDIKVETATMYVTLAPRITIT